MDELLVLENDLTKYKLYNIIINMEKEIKLFLFIIVFSLNAFYGYTQEIIELDELSIYDIVAGPIYGISGTESNQWKLYKIIKEQYSCEIIESEYYRTDSIIAKIYLYWILRENEWGNILVIYNDLMDHKNIKLGFAPGGCVIISELIGNIVNYDYNIYNRIDDSYYELIFPNIDDIFDLLIGNNSLLD